MGNVRSGYLRWPIGCIYDRTDAGSICPIAANDADELFDIMPADGEDRPAGRPAELGRAECIRLLGSVIELVLD